MPRCIWYLTMSGSRTQFNTEVETRQAARDLFDPEGAQSRRDDENFFWWARNLGHKYAVESTLSDG